MANPQLEAFAVKQREFTARQTTAVDGATADAEAQAALIKKLQDRPDGWTPEDQAILDEIQANNEALTTKLEALDALTPPVIPDVPPVETSGRR